MRPIITLTTDFGAESPYVAQMKGVILSICRDVELVDISHAITPQNIREGAVVLAVLHQVQVVGECPIDRLTKTGDQAHVRVELGDLDVRPLLADQELDVSFRYWEGAVEIAGTHHGRPIPTASAPIARISSMNELPFARALGSMPCVKWMTLPYSPLPARLS